jgi:hypothetical protein
LALIALGYPKILIEALKAIEIFQDYEVKSLHAEEVDEYRVSSW